jgi:hypothetical protein
LLDFLFPRRRLRRELEALRASIELKKAEVETSEREGRKAWGKKWSYIQMQRRGRDSGEENAGASTNDAPAGVFEMRLKRAQAELKAREKELADLVARESALAAELGEEPITPCSEANGEEH